MNQNPKVMLVAYSDPRRIGGAENYARILAKVLREKRLLRAFCFTSFELRGTASKVESVDGVPLYAIGLDGARSRIPLAIIAVLVQDPGHFVNVLVQSWRLMRDLHSIVPRAATLGRKYRFFARVLLAGRSMKVIQEAVHCDIVHCLNHELVMAAAWAGVRGQIVYSFLGHFWSARPSERFVETIALAGVAARISNKTFVTSTTMELVPTFWKVKPRTVEGTVGYLDEREIKDATNADLTEIIHKLGIGRDERVVSMIGRADSLYGYEDMLEALPLASRSIAGIRLVLCVPIENSGWTEPNYANVLAGAVNAATLESARITWLKKGLDHRWVLELCRISDIVAFTSRMGNISTTLLEALATGSVVLASDAPWTEKFIRDRVNGFTYRSGDIEDLRRKLVEILSDEESSLRVRAELLAEKPVKTYSIQESLPVLLRAYREILDNDTQRTP